MFFSVVILCAFLVSAISINLSRDRDANILIFCTKEYDTHATLMSSNTFYGDPNQCLNKMRTLVN